MVAKRSSRALALLLTLPSAAFALGLGEIHLKSPLNAPLDAEIELVDVAPEELATMQAQLASRDTFARYGLDYPGYLLGVQVHTVKTPDGREVIKLKTNDPISDPFITLLVEVNWARGRLVREYTVLLDPPVYTPGQSQLASAPVSAPATGTGTREGAIARNTETPAASAPAEAATSAPAEAAPATAAAMPVAAAAEAAAAAPATAEPAAAASTAAPASASASTAEATTPVPTAATSEPASASSTAAPEPAAPEPAAAEPAAPLPAAARASNESDSSTHVVHRGETLSEIAAGVAGDKATSAHGRSWMLAIYQANPRAFEKNMNLLRSGAVLRIPDAATAAAVSPAEASAEIRRQYAAWRGTEGTPAEAASAAAQPGRLKLVPAPESASATATASAGAAAQRAAETSALQGQVHDLQNQLAEQKRLLEMKDADLARLQAQLAAKQAAQPAPPAAPPQAPAARAAAPPPAAETAAPPVAQATPPAPPPEEKAAAPVEAPPPPVAAPPKPAPAHKAAPPPSSGSFFDTLASYWWLLLLALLGVAGVFGVRFLRSRRASQFDDSLGRLAVAGAAADFGAGGMGDLGDIGAASGGAGGGMSRGFASAEAPARATPPHVPDSAFLVEETGSHERPRPLAAGAAPAAAPRHVASDETISSETAINLDQGDPLAEADFHMAYGLYDQAADLIRIAISREPARRDLKLKLLEVFFVWGNKEQFLQTARELAETRGEAAPGEWEKILIMGKQLAPEDPLFSGGGAVTGAAAGGVDLDLEGGQSRVDFDLLGEAVPGDAPQGVDLDIGSAVGEHEASAIDSTTSATDRNVALLQSTVAGATGTTRQMTARMRDAGTGTAEIEGPTVEQPALVPRDQPTVRQKLETAMRQAGLDQTAELGIDDLGLDVGSVDTVDQPGPASAAASTPDAPTLVAGLDEHSRKVMEDAHTRAKEETAIASTGAWQFDQSELEAALTQTSLAVPDLSATSRLAKLRGQGIDVDVGATGTHLMTSTDVDVDVGTATGSHGANGSGLDLDVGTATVPDAAFAATQRLPSEDLALPDLEPVTMSEVGTKLDLARAYMDMGDPDGARNILEEVLHEGSAAQKQEAQRLMESLP